MLKLSGLMLATLAGLFAVLTIYGSEDLRDDRRPTARAVTADPAPDTGDPRLAETPAAAPAPAPDEPAALPAPQQTPAQVQQFPGPALEPSPEFADRTPAEASPDTSPDTAADTGPRLWVTASRLNMRSGPDSGASIVTGLDGGTALEPLGPTDGGWVHVRAPDGQTGYVSAQFVSDQPQ